MRTLRQRWEMVKRSDLQGFLATTKSVEITPRLEAALTEMCKSLKSLFSVLFCTGRGAVAPVSDNHLDTISSIQHTLQQNLKDYEDYLLVKGQRNVTMSAYPCIKIGEFVLFLFFYFFGIKFNLTKLITKSGVVR